MGATGFEPKDVSNLSTNDLEKQEDSSGAKSGALLDLLQKIVVLSEDQIKVLSKALTNSNPKS